MTKLIRKRGLQNLAVLFGSLFFLFLAAEGILRILSPKGLNLHKRFPQGAFCKRDSLLGWIGEPHATGKLLPLADDMDEMHIAMNSEGFLNTAHTVVKPPGTKRLLFLGDSFTIGFGVPKKDRFTNVIADHLRSNHEIINMGMWGYSTDQELLVLQEKGLKYDPDVVVLCLFLDDLYCSNLLSVNEGIYIKPKFALTSRGNLELRNVPVPNNHGRSALFNLILTRFYKLRNRLEMGAEFDRQGWISVFDKTYLEQEKYYLPLRLVSEINAFLKARHVNFFLVVLPDKDQLHEQHIDAAGSGYYGIPPNRLKLGLPQEMLKLFCQEMGIQVLDLLPVFRRHSHSEELFFKNDLHWTKAGHRLAAEAILTRIQTEGYL